MSRLRPGSKTVASLVTAAVLSGCGAAGGALSLNEIEQRPFAAPELTLSISLPAEVREGLERGVALTFRLDLAHGGASKTFLRELRYLPLTRQYRLREPGTDYSRSYGTRAAALAALERWPLPAGVSRNEVTARIRLDRTKLPAPLVLAAVFDADWRLDSGVKQWPARP